MKTSQKRVACLRAFPQLQCSGAVSDCCAPLLTAAWQELRPGVAKRAAQSLVRILPKCAPCPQAWCAHERRDRSTRRTRYVCAPPHTEQAGRCYQHPRPRRLALCCVRPVAIQPSSRAEKAEIREDLVFFSCSKGRILQARGDVANAPRVHWLRYTDQFSTMSSASADAIPPITPSGIFLYALEARHE